MTSFLFTPEDKTLFRELEAEQLGGSPRVPEGIPEEEKQRILSERAQVARGVRQESERRQAHNRAAAEIVNSPDLSEEEKLIQLRRIGATPAAEAAAADPKEYSADMVAPAPVAPPPERQAASDFGLAGAQARIGRAGRKYAGALEGLQEEARGLQERRRAGLEDQVALALDEAGQERVLLERREENLRGIAASREAMQADREKELGKQRATLGEARESLKYFNIPEDKRLELMERRSDTSLPEEERRKAAAELDKGSKVDPGRYMGNARNAIFAALGSALLGYVGRPEVAANIIQARIREDIRAQETARDARAGQVREAKGALAEMQRHFKDKDQALVAAEIMANEATKRELELLRTQYAGPREQLRAEELGAHLDQQNIELHRKFDQAAHNSIVKDEQARADIGARRAALAARGAGKQKDLRVPGMRLTGERVPAPDEAKKVADTRGQVVSVLEKIKDLRSHVNKFGREFGTKVGYTSDAAAVGEQMATDIALQYKDILNLGVLAGPDMDLLRDLIPMEPHQMFQKEVFDKLKQLEGGLRKQWVTQSRQKGYADTEISSGPPRQASEDLSEVEE